MWLPFEKHEDAHRLRELPVNCRRARSLCGVGAGCRVVDPDDPVATRRCDRAQLLRNRSHVELPTQAAERHYSAYPPMTAAETAHPVVQAAPAGLSSRVMALLASQTDRAYAAVP